MSNRIYSLFVLAAWLASMSWLFVAKIWPTLHGGDPPDYSASVADTPKNRQPIVWRISWKDRRIGTAGSQAFPTSSGTRLRYVVQFEQMPLEMMLSEAFGVFGSMFFRDRAGANAPSPGSHSTGQKTVGSDETAQLENAHAVGLDLLIATELRFDHQQQFTGFQCVADLGDMRGLLEIQGTVDERRKLLLKSRLNAPFGGGAAKELKQEVDLPSNAVVGDAFAPRSELKKLHVGQKWTIPVYRPFPPNSPVQIVAAHAERHELILWDGRDVETILVVYRSDAGVGLQSARDPIAREWVRDDGLILQQEVRWSGSVIRFERLPDALQEPIEQLLSSAAHSRLWSQKPAAPATK